MYFVRLAAVLKNFLLAWYLGPSQFGFVAAFLTLLTYSAYLDLGLFHAVYRELPMLRGAGRTARITRLVDTAFGGSLLLGAVAAAVLAVLSVFQALDIAPGPWWLGLGLAVAVFGQLLAGVPYNVALGEGRFNPLGRALAFAAAVDLIATVSAGLAWGAAGAVLAGSLGLFVQFVLVRELISRRPRFRWDLEEAKRLAAIGIPIALIWFSNANFIAIDKIVALVGLGKVSLGLYTLATAASSLAMVGPVAVATRFGPRVLERIGESSAGEAAIEAARAGVHVAARASAIVLAGGLVAISPVTHALLPEYVPAIRAAQILLAGGAILASTFPLTTYLIGRGLQWRVVRIYAAAAVLNLALDAALLWLDQGITGIAVGSLVSYALFSLAVQKMVAALDSGPHTLWRLARAFWPLPVAALAGALGSTLLYALDLV
jgi:O-antigen/teichoic acid export membrane protein